MSEETTAGDPQADLTLEEILDQLNQPFSGTLPVDALRATQARREEITPFLIKLIQDATRTLAEDEDPHLAQRQGPLFALLLLTEFRAKEALPVILEALCLPDDDPEIVFASDICEVVPRVLAVLAEDRLDAIGDCIDDQNVNESVRWGMAAVYMFLVRDGQLTRDEAVNRLRGHLQNAIENRDEILAEAVVCELERYSPHEALGEIERAFQEDLLDPAGWIDFEDITRSIDEGEAHFQEELECLAPSGVRDTVEELSGWYSYQDHDDEFDDDYDLDDDYDEGEFGSFYLGSNYQDEPPLEPVGTIRNTEPRIGRNQPCPCGSGKKYKKCCGKP